MKRRTKIIIAACALAAVGAIVLAAVNAAYYGKGMFKDVFVNGANFFSSDVLGSVSSVDELERISVSSNGAKRDIHFYNYDLSSGEYDLFDIEFSVYAWLDASGKACSLDYGGRSYSISGTSMGEPLLTAKLKGGEASLVTLTLSFEGADDTNIGQYPSVYLLAVPQTPKFMAARMLGALIEPSMSGAFALDCYFEHSDGDDINDFAAFPYVISTIGQPPVGKKLILKWDATRLSLITPAHLLPAEPSETVEGGRTYKSIAIEVSADYFDRISFMRVQDLPEGASNIWDAEYGVDWAMLEGFVSCEMEQ